MKHIDKYMDFIAFYILCPLVVLGMIGLVISVIYMHYGPPAYKKYRLASGNIVECSISVDERCGTTLYRCKNGFSYSCQTNVERIS